MNNIEELFTPYQESLELKELGFNKSCIATYTEDENFELQDFEQNYDTFPSHIIAAPLFSQAFKFFRDKYNWQHSIEPTADQHRFEVGYNYWIWNSKTGEEYHTMSKNRPTGDWEYETYEQAELECLKHLIKIVKENEK